MNPEEQKLKLKLYSSGFDRLKATLKEIPRKAWKFKPAPSEWSIHQIILHLADSEANAALRVRLLAVEPGRTVMAYDQDKWAADLNYHDQDVDDALKLIKITRKMTARWLKSAPASIIEHSIIHPEYDQPYTYNMWLTVYSEHIPGHIEQIKNNYAAWREHEA